MRPAEVNSNLIGKKLAKTVFTADGRPLLTAGVTLTPAYLDALRRRGFTVVYVQNELLPDLEVDEALNSDTRVRATRIIKESMDRLAAGYEINVKAVSDAVNDILNDLTGNSDLVFSLSSLRSVDEYTFTHSVNVCAIALIAGQSLHYTRQDLHKLGVGALLHDIGKVQMGDIVRKPGKLSPEEWERMKTHPTIGYELLRTNFEISLLSAHVAFQHHERMDGSGYPRGLAGGDIHEFGRIGAVADVYDALASDRPYRKRLDPATLAAELQGMAGDHLDPEIVRKLLARMALYPTGSIVLLATRQVAVVVRQTMGDPAHPVVRVVTDSDYNLVEPFDVSLAEREDLTVHMILPDYPVRVQEQIRRRQQDLIGAGSGAAPSGA